MRHRKRPAIMAKDSVEDLSHWQEGAVNTALAYRNDSAELVRRVADEDDYSFTRRASDLTHRHGRDVGGGPQPLRTRVVLSVSSQAEARDDSRRPVASDT